jgi:exopolysaccharide biosynthesis polyprenyl glycosylphosphotransferase
LQGRVEDVGVRADERKLEVAHPIEAPQSARAQYRHLSHWTALTDVASIALAMLLAFFARELLLAEPEGFNLKPDSAELALIVATPLVTILFYSALHLYEAFRYTPAEEFRRIVIGVSLGITAVVTLSFWSKSPSSRGWVAITWALALVFALISRRLWHAYIGRARTSGQLVFPTLVVGTNDEARHLVEKMERPSFGFRAVAMVATRRPGGPDDDGVPVIGSVTDLRELIRETNAECVFVASSAVGPEEMTHIAKAVRLEGVEVRITATLPEVLSSRLSVQPFGGVTTLSLRPVQLSGLQAVLKRAFDLVVAGLGLVMLLPVFVVISLLVKLSSSGPVLYKQRRVGQRGRPFTMLKFRTMRNGAEKEVQKLRDENGVSDLMFKMKDDPRVTRIGRFLRRFSLDELPQLINVIRGQMSLVGPRPPLAEEVAQYEEWQFDRLEVPPGITGLWQVSGRSELSFDECVRLDLFYIENWSLAYDFYIIAKSIPALLSQKGAY